MIRARPLRRCAGLVLVAALGALAAACVGYTTGPGGTTIHRVGLPVAAHELPPATSARPQPTAIR